MKLLLSSILSLSGLTIIPFPSFIFLFVLAMSVVSSSQGSSFCSIPPHPGQSPHPGPGQGFLHCFSSHALRQEARVGVNWWCRKFDRGATSPREDSCERFSRGTYCLTKAKIDDAHFTTSYLDLALFIIHITFMF